MKDGMVAKPIPAVSNHTTRRGSAMEERDSSHAVATVASEPPHEMNIAGDGARLSDVEVGTRVAEMSASNR